MLTIRQCNTRRRTKDRRRLFTIPLITVGDVLVMLSFWSCPSRRLGTSPSLRLDHQELIELHQVLVERFDCEELQTLCFYVNVDYESLTGRGKSGKARELIKHLQRRDRLFELVQRIQNVRPDISLVIESTIGLESYGMDCRRFDDKVLC